MSESHTQIAGVEVLGAALPASDLILTPEALAFVARLERAFGARREALLARRAERQAELDRGWRPGFPAETEAVRTGDWQVAPVPGELQDRRVEITGPAEAKMIINGLNSGAKVFMADFEDALTPDWARLVEGQASLREAVAGTLTYDSPEGKHYALEPQRAVLFVRPRGWHLVEKHVRVDGCPVSAALFDFGLYCFHNAKTLLARGSAPYFYLPKLEGYLEARLWNEVFLLAQQELGIPAGTFKATVLIETVLAAFEMDEILYELRQHSAGLNCGRWDYLFSCIKKFRNDPGFVLADRALVTMTAPFMRAYTRLAIKTCHRRGAHAMGGMAAQIPIKGDPEGTAAVLAKVRADKAREAADGHDGSWVAHPGLVQTAREAFDGVMPGPNQLDRPPEATPIGAEELLAFGPRGPITEAGLRTNIEVSIHYIGAWLAGCGAVPIHHLMEDAATAEVSRSQVWHWIRSSLGVLEDGRKVTLAMVLEMIPEEVERIRADLGEAGFAAGRYPEAAKLFEEMASDSAFVEFLTLPAYGLLA